MPHNNPTVRVYHMLQVAEELVSFVDGKTYDDLLADRGLQYICIHCLELIGEAASKIDAEYTNRHPDIPWRSVTALRNRLIHGYFDLDLETVWAAAIEDVPALIPHLRTLLATEQ